MGGRSLTPCTKARLFTSSRVAGSKAQPFIKGDYMGIVLEGLMLIQSNERNGCFCRLGKFIVMGRATLIRCQA